MAQHPNLSESQRDNDEDRYRKLSMCICALIMKCCIARPPPDLIFTIPEKCDTSIDPSVINTSCCLRVPGGFLQLTLCERRGTTLTGRRVYRRAGGITPKIYHNHVSSFHCAGCNGLACRWRNLRRAFFFLSGKITLRESALQNQTMAFSLHNDDVRKPSVSS